MLGLLPGSRPAEMRRVAPTLFDAVGLSLAAAPGARVICMAAPSVATEVERQVGEQPYPVIVVRDEAEKADAYAAMTVAIACSGTVTTELAVQGAAVVTGYRLGWITWGLLRAFLFKSRYSALVNVAVNRDVIPEFIQTRFRADLIAKSAIDRLSRPDVLRAQQEGQREAIRIMSGDGKSAAVVSAEAILKLS